MNHRVRAGDLVIDAERIRAEEMLYSTPSPARFAYADATEARARTQVPDSMAELGAGGEPVPVEAFGFSAAELRNTVERPDNVAIDASRDRLQQAFDAGCLEQALDMADTIAARNSLERALAHQMAAAHRSAMKLTTRLNRCIEMMEYSQGAEQEAANVHAARLTGSIARMMAAFQQGALTLERLRNGGRQVVIVQHVNVGHGGQAVVAGKVASRGRQKKSGGEEQK
jgi:hypothetical protein